MTAVQPQTVVRWMSILAEDVAAQADHLTQLDAAIGDGDHGINMNRGMAAVVGALAEQDDGVAPGRLLIVAGKTLVSTVGGASGPLWGSFFRGAGRALGAAVPGDKTMVDALLPAVDALRDTLAGGASLTAAASRAAEAAAEGARATVPLQARKGRASYLGERSVGHEDPGAASSVIVIGALARAIG